MSGVGRTVRSSHYATTRTAQKTPTYGTGSRLGAGSASSASSNSSLSSSGLSSSGTSSSSVRRSASGSLTKSSIQTQNDEGHSRYTLPPKAGSTSSVESTGSARRYLGKPTTSASSRYTRERTPSSSDGSSTPKSRERSSSKVSVNSASGRYRDSPSSGTPRKRGSVISQAPSASGSTQARPLARRSSPGKLDRSDTPLSAYSSYSESNRTEGSRRRLEKSPSVRSPDRFGSNENRGPVDSSRYSSGTSSSATSTSTSGHPEDYPYTPSPKGSVSSHEPSPSHKEREREQMRATIDALQQEIAQLKRERREGSRTDSSQLSPSSQTGGGGKMVMQREGNRHMCFPTVGMEICKRQNLGNSNGMVYRCNMAGYTFVAKKIEICSESGKQELAILERLNHRNIVTFLGHETTDRGDSCFLYMEYMPYTLHSYMNRLQLQRRVFRESQMRTVATEIIKGLHYLHHQVGSAIMHRDLKSKNVLIDADQDGEIQAAKLCDFGVSKILTPGAQPNTMVGTYYWMAPEILADTAMDYTMAADIWSYGMVLVEVATLKTPYSENGMNWSLTKQQILSGTLPKLPPNCPAFLTMLIQACLRRRPEDRPTTEQVILMLLEE